MQQSDINHKNSGLIKYGYPSVKGSIIAAALLIAASFISGDQAKKKHTRQELAPIDQDLQRFEKSIQDSKKLLKKNRP